MIQAGLSSLEELEAIKALEQPKESSQQETSDSVIIADTINSRIEILNSYDPS